MAQRSGIEPMVKAAETIRRKWTWSRMPFLPTGVRHRCHVLPSSSGVAMTIATIDPTALHERMRRGEPCLRLDVRTPVEHRELHDEGVELMPLDALDPAAVRQRSGDQPVYVFCRSGGRATQAAERLSAAGVANCLVVAGGTLAWAEAGLPVVRGSKAMSLERQVRIAAGTLVLIGVGLGLGVHPGCFGIAAFVGAGLIFAGVTDRCGMAMMLGRMPWNRIAGAKTGTACR